MQIVEPKQEIVCRTVGNTPSVFVVFFNEQEIWKIRNSPTVSRWLSVWKLSSKCSRMFIWRLDYESIMSPRSWNWIATRCTYLHLLFHPCYLKTTFENMYRLRIRDLGYKFAMISGSSQFCITNFEVMVSRSRRRPELRLTPTVVLPRDAVHERNVRLDEEPGGSVRGERANFTRLVLGCIEAKFCK